MSKIKKASVPSKEDISYLENLKINYQQKINQIETCFSEDSHPTSLRDKITNTLIEFKISFDLLDHIIGFCEKNKGYSREIEKLVPVPIEKLNLLELEFSNLNMRENLDDFYSECTGLLKNIMHLIEKMEYFKILYNSNSIFKLQNFLLLLIKFFPRNTILASSSINILVALIKKGFDNSGSFLDILLTLIQDLISDKGSIGEFATLTDLMIKFLSAVALKGFHQFENQENAFDFSQKSGLNLDTIIDNKTSVLKNVDRITSFFIERFKTTKASGFKKFWKFFCDYCFNSFSNTSDLMPSTVTISLLEKLIQEIKSPQEGLAFRISFFDLLIQFQKRQYEGFTLIFAKMIRIITAIRDNKIASLKRDSSGTKDCNFCKDKDTQYICETCEILSECIEKSKAKQKLKKASPDTIIEHSRDLAKLIRVDKVFNHLCQSNTNSSKEKASVLAFLVGFVEDESESHSLYDPSVLESLSVNLLQSKISQESQQKSFSDIYMLALFPAYSRLLEDITECCVILSNENSANLRIKSLNFLHEICKIAPKTFKENDTFKGILESRVYDSSHNVRLLSLEILEEYHRAINDHKDKVFNLILERNNDISTVIRKNVVKFIHQNLHDLHSESLEEGLALKKQLFLILSRKTLDTEEISSYSKTACLLLLFNSFQPHEKVGKRYSIKYSSQPINLKKDVQKLHQSFENGLALLKYAFEKMGDEWYQNLVDYSKDIGSFNTTEILEYITFVITKLHNDDENEDYLFYLSVLKPFSKSFSAQFIPELNYFYLSLCNFNQSSDSEESQKTRPYLKKFCEIIQNIILNHDDKLSSGNSRKFSNIEKELYQLVYRENLVILSSALKTISLITKNISKNYYSLKDLFIKCMKLIDVSLKNDDKLNGESSSILRASYIVSFIIKYMSIDELFQLDSQNSIENDTIEDVYENLLVMLKAEKIEIRRAAIECISCLWEKKPLLALKSKDIINNFINSDNDELKFQIFKIFYNILTEYRENNQSFFLKLKENFTNKVKKGSKTVELTTTSSRSGGDISSVIQLISEGISNIMPKIHEFSSEIKQVVLKVILLLLKEGHCHVHTIFKRVFALITSENSDIRALSTEIIQLSVQRNSSMAAFELESAILETYALQDKANTNILFYENSENEKSACFDELYEFFINHAKERELFIKNPIDSACTLLLTQGSNSKYIKFISDFVLSLSRISGEDLRKWVLAMNSFVEKRYQKVITLFKSILKDDEEIDKEFMTKNNSMISSLFIAVANLLVVIRLAKDNSNERSIFGNINEDNITLIIEAASHKIFDQNIPVSIKLGLNSSRLETFGNILAENLELLNSPSKQNLKTFYKNLKILYTGGEDSYDLLEPLEIEIVNLFDKKSMSKKKKVLNTKKVETPEKKKSKVRGGKTTLKKKADKMKNFDYPVDKENFDINLKKDSKWESRLRRRRTLTSKKAKALNVIHKSQKD